MRAMVVAQVIKNVHERFTVGYSAVLSLASPSAVRHIAATPTPRYWVVAPATFGRGDPKAPLTASARTLVLVPGIAPHLSWA
jgi:hypothetical protein